jgi:Zinc carboxypeptidase
MSPLRPCTASLGVAVLASLLAFPPAPAEAQSKAAAAKTQAQDEAYTAKIKEYTVDPRVITELVDHLPASDKIPSPLKVLGRIPGTPDELTYSKDIYRYFDTLAQAAPTRVKVARIGKTEEGRDMISVVIADDATIKTIDKWKGLTAKLTDSRSTDDATAKQLIATGKPIYYLTGSIHSPETGSPEMLMELAYRLVVEDTPFIQQIRNNVIVVITPLIEVDGHDKQVDTWYFRKKTGQTLPLMYWGKYVAHDNNRDGMGQSLKLTQNIMSAFLDWHPTVLHDLHESVPYLYTSTGSGPYNTSLDPVVIDEWWVLAKYEVSEFTKRGVPGVWTYGFYDGWVPNYLFFIANSHNAIGRFYETQSYGPQKQEVTLGATSTSREWFRPNPPLSKINWGPRNNVNLQESGVLLALNYVAKNKDTFLENYWLKNKRSVERGKNEAPYAWVIPAGQRRKGEVASVVNLFRRQGVEVHKANAAFTAGKLQVAAGDYILRMDQPYRTLVDMLMGTQFYAPANPAPYDDTGWTLPLLRNIKAVKAEDKSVLTQPMTLLTADAVVPGMIAGSGGTLIVDHNADNTLMTFRFKNADVKMSAAEEGFEVDGQHFAAGSFIVPTGAGGGDRAKLEASIKELGLTARAVGTAPTVKMHDLDVPRIGYVHAWQRTQDEGWVRMALDTFGVPYTYFADQKLREGNLRAKYDVIVYPHVGGSPQSHINGLPMTGKPLPYKKTTEFPNIGVNDDSDDIRGGMGLEGLANLVKFVQDGGTLIVEGSTAALLPAYGAVGGVNVEEPTSLFARGTILKSVFADKKSPIAYGFDVDAPLAVYFNQGPVLRAGAGGFGGFGGGGGGGAGGGGQQIPGVGMNITPNAVPETLTSLEPKEPGAGRGAGAGAGAGAGERPQGEEAARFRQAARQAGIPLDESRPRVILRFPTNPNDMLLSGALVGGDALSGRAVAVDAPLGKGHVVMFATRPYWRSQTQGLYFLGFNAILNWNDLDAGKPAPPEKTDQP